jgi:hypothetical protein
MSAVAIKISKNLAEAARSAAEWSDRSITGQIEHWASLGKAVESQISVAAAMELKKCGGNLNALESSEQRVSLESVLQQLGAVSSGNARSSLAAKLRQEHTYLYESSATHPGCVERIAADGTRVIGKMVEGKFVAQPT